MLSRRQLLSAPLLLGAIATLGTRMSDAHALEANPAAPIDTTSILDGESPVDAVQLSELARDRVRLAANWLVGAQRPT